MFSVAALETIKKSLYSIIQRGDDEIAFVALTHALVLVKRSPYSFSDDFGVFFLRHVDAAYIKAIKLDILKYLATSENQRLLVAELLEYTKVLLFPLPVCFARCDVGMSHTMTSLRRAWHAPRQSLAVFLHSVNACLQSWHRHTELPCGMLVALQQARHSARMLSLAEMP
jgi:hypothetical protein